MMNKLFLYIIIILIFLGLSKGISSYQNKIDYISNKKALSHHFQGQPLDLILLDAFQVGFVVKSYYLKVQLIKYSQKPSTLIIKANKNLWKEMKSYLGMSIFRRKDQSGFSKRMHESVLPLPPGSLYIGDSSFGTWAYLDSGKKVWQFHKMYQDLPQKLFWGDFQPSFKFYQQMKIHQKKRTPFYGLNKEFGIEGSLTKKQITSLREKPQNIPNQWSDQLSKYISLPPWKLKRKQNL